MKKIPVIQELGEFQKVLSRQSSLFLTFSSKPYYGGNDPRFQSNNKKDHPSNSQFHGGLMSSRLLVCCEQILIFSLFKILLEKQCIPLCLEHDGLLVLTNNEKSLEECRRYVLQKSKELVGVEIDMESQDQLFDMKDFA